MDLYSSHATTKLEDELSGVYEILHKKESHLAVKIKQYATSKENNNTHQTLFLNIALNVCAITWLHYLFC
jgi:hypothetical protein